jgi:hypothetical protein
MGEGELLDYGWSRDIGIANNGMEQDDTTLRADRAAEPFVFAFGSESYFYLSIGIYFSHNPFQPLIGGIFTFPEPFFARTYQPRAAD